MGFSGTGPHSSNIHAKRVNLKPLKPFFMIMQYSSAASSLGLATVKTAFENADYEWFVGTSRKLNGTVGGTLSLVLVERAEKTSSLLPPGGSERNYQAWRTAKTFPRCFKYAVIECGFEFTTIYKIMFCLSCFYSSIIQISLNVQLSLSRWGKFRRDKDADILIWIDFSCYHALTAVSFTCLVIICPKTPGGKH